MGRTRTRVDEEALIPRNDMEEFHTAIWQKAQRRRSCFCSVKCWFAMFLLLVLASTTVFYFIYPSIVHENINKFIGFACSASGYAPQSNVTVTCLVLTSASAISTKATAIDKTWGSQCTAIFYFYENNPDQPRTTLKNAYRVDDVRSLQPFSISFNASEATSWYLETDDNTFVSYEKLQRLLSTKQSSRAVYVGNEIASSDVGAFALNREAVKAILGRVNSVKTENVVNSVRTVLNVTSKDVVPGFAVNIPLIIKDAQQMTTMSKACAFGNVSMEQMYSFYVLGGA